MYVKVRTMFYNETQHRKRKAGWDRIVWGKSRVEEDEKPTLYAEQVNVCMYDAA